MDPSQLMREVQRDCTLDAERLDRSSFTGKDIGPLIGGMLAMIQAVARTLEGVIETQDALAETVGKLDLKSKGAQ